MLPRALLLVALAALAGCGGASGGGAPAGCAGPALAGAFAVVPHSAGAGNIVYRLRLTNQSDAPCFVSGLPVVQLLDAQGGKLPTNVSPAHPGTATAVRVDLAPGDAAAADARFSPDIPGGSEPTDAPCEPKASTLRVTIGDGTVDAPVDPPTPVCERGSLNFSNFTAAQ